MQPPILAVFFDFSSTAFWMSAAGLALFVIGLLAARNDIVRARGIDKIAGLTKLAGAKSLVGLVPPYMPWRLFWAYFAGVALIAAALSIATKILVRWSGLLFGTMMLLFVAMIHIPAALAGGERIAWTIVIREMSFGGGGWLLAGTAVGRRRSLVTVGRMLIASAMGRS